MISYSSLLSFKSILLKWRLYWPVSNQYFVRFHPYYNAEQIYTYWIHTVISTSSLLHCKPGNIIDKKHLTLWSLIWSLICAKQVTSKLCLSMFISYNNLLSFELILSKWCLYWPAFNRCPYVLDLYLSWNTGF